MRTALDISDDVLLAVNERARREKRRAGEVLSEVAREALTHRLDAPVDDEPESFFGLRPLPRRGAVITNELINQLRDE